MNRLAPLAGLHFLPLCVYGLQEYAQLLPPESTFMPANLPPQYQKVEEQYRRCQVAQERLGLLEEMLVLIPKHKGTEKLQADLKTRLKETKEEVQAEKSAPKTGAKTFKVLRQGAATIVIIGAPNAGKSRILKELTSAEPLVADYPFSTREPLPGMMKWEDVVVQLIDTPPITDSQCEPYMTNLVRTADLVVLAFDGANDDAPAETAEVLRQLKQRKTLLSDRTGFDDDDFSLLNVKTLLAVTHGADGDCSLRVDMLRDEHPLPFVIETVELEVEADRERLRNAIWQALGLLRLYTKAPGKPADFSNPYTLPAGARVEDLAGKVHRDLFDKVKSAKIWGTSAKDGQTVGRDHVLADRDLVELHT